MTITTKFNVGDLVSWKYGDGFDKQSGIILSIEVYAQKAGRIVWYNVETPNDKTIRIQEDFLNIR